MAEYLRNTIYCLKISPTEIDIEARCLCPICKHSMLITALLVHDDHTILLEGICFGCPDRDGENHGRYRYFLSPCEDISVVSGNELIVELPITGKGMSEIEIQKLLRSGKFSGT